MNPYDLIPYYGDYRLTDQFLLDSYGGKGGYLTGLYLVRHLRESDDKFKRRRACAVYPNITRKIVDVFMGYLWRQAPNREVSDLYNQFMVNADGAGGKLDALLASYQRLAMILGTVYIIVDKPETQGPTRADQSLPYLGLRMKKQLEREQKDAAGRWLSVTFVESSTDEIAYETFAKTVYRTFTRTGWKLSYDIEGREIIRKGEHNLGRVPVVALHIARPVNPWDSCAETWVYDLAVLNWELYNLRSELRDLERSQTFAILALPVATPEERERLQDLSIGTENGLTYDPTGGGKPEFIAPPSEPTTHYMARMGAIIQDIYRVANLEFVGGVQQSGVALSFHFQEANSSLRTMAEQCEAAENAIAQLVYAWQGQTWDGNIAYANDFNLSDLAQAVSLAMDSVLLGMGPEFDKAVKKRLAKQILGNDVAPSTLAAIDQEIDAQGDPMGDRLQRQADVSGG